MLPYASRIFTGGALSKIARSSGQCVPLQHVPMATGFETLIQVNARARPTRFNARGQTSGYWVVPKQIQAKVCLLRVLFRYSLKVPGAPTYS